LTDNWSRIIAGAPFNSRSISFNHRLEPVRGDITAPHLDRLIMRVFRRPTTEEFLKLL